MGNIWKWVAILAAFMLVISLALVGVAYATGGSVDRVLATTDITDMTKYVSRDQLELYVTRAINLINRVF